MILIGLVLSVFVFVSLPSTASAIHIGGSWENLFIRWNGEDNDDDSVASVYVPPPVMTENLFVYCNANPKIVDIDEDVTWRAYASGGNGSYTYDWSGMESLDGNSRNVSWSYDHTGTKRATVTVTSQNQVASASCTAKVEDNYNYDYNYNYDHDYNNLSVYCYTNPANPQVDQEMRWFCNVSGGDGDYRYDWSGSEGLNSSSRSPYMVYNTPGSKSATVVVRDGDGNRTTRTFYTNVNSVLGYSQTYQPTYPTYQTPMAGAVYLSQVPYTGIEDNYKLVFFLGILTFFSAWIAYIIVARKSQTEA